MTVAPELGDMMTTSTLEVKVVREMLEVGIVSSFSEDLELAVRLLEIILLFY